VVGDQAERVITFHILQPSLCPQKIFILYLQLNYSECSHSVRKHEKLQVLLRIAVI
jgi:hypothetical protein